jgi:integrase/recombinase XerD
VCLFLTTNGIEVSPIQISEETVQQLYFSSDSRVAGENIRTKSFFVFNIRRLSFRQSLELIESQNRKKLPDILSVDEIDSLIASIDLTSNGENITCA